MRISTENFRTVLSLCRDVEEEEVGDDGVVAMAIEPLGEVNFDGGDMRIAVSAKGMDLTSQVDPRFGRAAYFIVYDTDSEDFEVLQNQDNVNAAQGAGIQTAEKISGKGVDVIVSGSVGPKAAEVLKAAGVKSVQWSDGTVSQAIEMLKNGALRVE